MVWITNKNGARRRVAPFLDEDVTPVKEGENWGGLSWSNVMAIKRGCVGMVFMGADADERAEAYAKRLEAAEAKKDSDPG